MSLFLQSGWVMLGGLLVAVPILVHLIMRRKPIPVLFPAMRFLLQKKKTNLRKLRLRHFLLLLLRCLLILAMAFALARPIVTNMPGALAIGSPLAVIMVFDTSPSMEYKIEEKTRLDQAKELAQQYTSSLPAGSEVAIIETGEGGGGRFTTPMEASTLIGNRKIQATSRTLNSALEDAIRMLEKNPPKLPILICAFSDRTAASWDGSAVSTFLLPAKVAMETKLARPINTVFYDLGAAEPRNLAIASLGVRPASSSTATPLEELRFGSTSVEPIQIVATVQSTGLSGINEVMLYMDGKAEPVDRKTVEFKTPAGQMETKIIPFAPMTLKQGIHQGRVAFRSPDSLEPDNQRFWTLSIPQRRVLILADSGEDTFDWQTAIESLSIFPMACEVRKPSDIPAGLSPDDFQAVCLFNIAAPKEDLWNILNRYVSLGGGLFVSLGGDAKIDNYNGPLPQSLLPGKLIEIKKNLARGRFFELQNYDHPAAAPFKRWQMETGAYRIKTNWTIEPLPGNQAALLATLGGEEKPTPVWLERVFDRNKTPGRVLMMTTALYSRPTDPNWTDWNDFNKGPLFLALAYSNLSYLISAREEKTNHTLEEDVRVFLPQRGKVQEYTVKGPINSSGKVEAAAGSLFLKEAKKPGNFIINDAGGSSWSRSFSVNMSAKENLLGADRPTAEELQKFFGPEGVSTSGEAKPLTDLARDALGISPRSELLPYLLLLVLLFLAGENFLANRFYKNEPEVAQS